MLSNESILEEYPQWLTNNAFIDGFDWENVNISSFEKLLDLMTLHDSYWIGAFSYLDNSTNLIINLDAIWNKELLGYLPEEETGEWPYLIIKLEKTYNIIFDSDIDCGTTIADVKTEILNDSKIVKTKIEDVCNGFIEILHDEIIKFQIFDTKANIIELPNKE